MIYLEVLYKLLHLHSLCVLCHYRFRMRGSFFHYTTVFLSFPSGHFFPPVRLKSRLRLYGSLWFSLVIMVFSSLFFPN